MSLGPRLGAKPVVATCQVVNVCRASASLPSMNQCLPEAHPRQPLSELQAKFQVRSGHFP